MSQCSWISSPNEVERNRLRAGTEVPSGTEGGDEPQQTDLSPASSFFLRKNTLDSSKISRVMVKVYLCLKKPRGAFVMGTNNKGMYCC